MCDWLYNILLVFLVVFFLNAAESDCRVLSELRPRTFFSEKLRRDHKPLSVASGSGESEQFINARSPTGRGGNLPRMVQEQVMVRKDESEQTKQPARQCAGTT